MGRTGGNGFHFPSRIILIFLIAAGAVLLGRQGAFTQQAAPGNETPEGLPPSATQPAEEKQSPTTSTARQHKGLTTVPGVSMPAQQEAEGTFQEKCSSCHGEKGDGYGPWHSQFAPPPANLGLVRDSPAMLKSIVVNGIPGAMMPAHPDLDEQTFKGVLAFLAAQPADLSNQWDHPWPLAADLKKLNATQGAKEFVTFCMGCHGPEGSGKSDFAEKDSVWPKPANFHARNSEIGRLYFIITHGRPGTFMAPTKALLTPATRWQLALYVQSLYDPKSEETIRTTKQPPHRVSNPYYKGDMTTVNAGRERYSLWCSPCHGGNGHGSFLAPRLIDRRWRFGGGTDTAVFTVVSEGVPGQLMPSFQKIPENIRWQMITYLRHYGGLPEALAVEQERTQPPGQNAERQIRTGGQ